MIIFDKAVLHGCAELEKIPCGAIAPLRVPMYVTKCLSERGQMQSRANTGIELRFVINSGDVKITMHTDDDARGEATVFHGEFLADWPETTKEYRGDSTTFTVVQSPNIAELRKIARSCGHGFSPDVVRIMFRGERVKILSIDGDISIPTEEMLPKRKYFAYGSSITHGSIGLHPVYNYTSRVAKHFGADVLNYGFAGSACLEPSMADYIADNIEFDFATLEMGVNILGIDSEDFEKRVRYFVKRIAQSHPESRIFAIDLYLCHSDLLKDGRAEKFRRIVREVTEELALPNVTYINGKTILTSPSGFTSGLVHPGPDGISEMVQNLCTTMAKYI